MKKKRCRLGEGGGGWRGRDALKQRSGSARRTLGPQGRKTEWSPTAKVGLPTESEDIARPDGRAEDNNTLKQRGDRTGENASMRRQLTDRGGVGNSAHPQPLPQAGGERDLPSQRRG